VAIPARVEKYTANPPKVDVKPLIKDTMVDDEGNQIAISVPIIQSVPVHFPGGGKFRITFPIAVGDEVLLIFSERSIDKWAVLGGEVDPKDPRRHALSDAIAIPGLRNFKNALEDVSTTSMKLGEDDSGLQIELSPTEINLADGTNGVARIGDTTVPHAHPVIGTAGPFPVVATATPVPTTIQTGSLKVKAG
jgi:hypothetical protein